MNPISIIMPKLMDNINLSRNESENVFNYLTSGEASEVEMAAFLATLSVKGIKF